MKKPFSKVDGLHEIIRLIKQKSNENKYAGYMAISRKAINFSWCFVLFNGGDIEVLSTKPLRAKNVGTWRQKNLALFTLKSRRSKILEGPRLYD